MTYKSIFYDPVMLMVLGLLAATLYAFLSGLFSYPFGWLILIAVAFARIQYLRRH